MANVDINDFDDLGKPITFKFQNRIYEVPIPTPAKSKMLLKMGRDIQRKSKANEQRLLELEANNQDIPDDLQNEMDAIFDFQTDFILEAGLVEVNDISKVSVEKPFIIENWPNKLILRVFRMINDNFVESEQEKKS